MFPSRRTAALAVLGFLVALLAAMTVLPARWLIRVLDPALPIAIANAGGTVWNGTALVAIGPPENRRMIPGAVTWHWGWNGVDVRHPWLAGALHLQPSWHGLRISGQSLNAPADALVALGAPFNTLVPTGRLELKWPAYAPGSSGPAPLFEAQWLDAGSALSTVQPLGNYRLVATRTAKGDVALKLATLQGRLRLQADGSWDGTRLRLEGVAEPSPETSENERIALDPLLTALGRRSGTRSTFTIGSSSHP
jgi:general secretion pathway protein N